LARKIAVLGILAMVFLIVEIDMPAKQTKEQVQYIYSLY
jgi:hypothetical protein